MKKDDIRLGLQSLAVFKYLQEDPVIKALLALLSEETDLVLHYSSFLNELYQEEGDLGSHILKLLDSKDSFYLKKESLRNNPHIKDAAEAELGFLSRLSSIPSSDIASFVYLKEKPCNLPTFSNSSYDFLEIFKEKIRELPIKGYGIFTENLMFRFSDREIVPVLNPDRQKLNDLTGYENERGKLVANTEAFLEGKPSGNVLLYGDSGTGKSSTVKAVANAYFSQGLRLLDLKKKQLSQLPLVLDILKDNPLKFIVFIDDLTFMYQDENFTALKSVLEGGAAVLPKNVLIYATSNRRHLVKETHEDRLGTDLHENDTREEITGLGNRFHLTITFTRPSKELYLDIVKSYALLYQIPLSEELFNKGEAYALRSGGRSGRAAKQFIQLEKALL
ncbi:MAG: DUF815 domain-containing protein [Clostridiales bacterium]|nr:DUF815 domain-containing protein [Clostridiales bacterium]